MSYGDHFWLGFNRNVSGRVKDHIQPDHFLFEGAKYAPKNKIKINIKTKLKATTS